MPLMQNEEMPDGILDNTKSLIGYKEHLAITEVFFDIQCPSLH